MADLKRYANMKPFLAHIGYHFGKKVLVVTVLLVTVFCVAGLILLSEMLTIPALIGVACFVLVVGGFTAFFSVPEILARLEGGAAAGVTFTDAVVLTYRRYFILLSFLPVIGFVFRPLVKHDDVRRTIDE